MDKHMRNSAPSPRDATARSRRRIRSAHERESAGKEGINCAMLAAIERLRSRRPLQYLVCPHQCSIPIAATHVDVLVYTRRAQLDTNAPRGSRNSGSWSSIGAERCTSATAPGASPSPYLDLRYCAALRRRECGRSERLSSQRSSSH